MSTPSLIMQRSCKMFHRKVNIKFNITDMSICNRCRKRYAQTVNMIERQKVSQRAAADANQKTGLRAKLQAVHLNIYFFLW